MDLGQIQVGLTEGPKQGNYFLDGHLEDHRGGGGDGDRTGTTHLFLLQVLKVSYLRCFKEHYIVLLYLRKKIKILNWSWAVPGLKQMMSRLFP